MGMTTLLTLTAMFSSVSSTCLLYSHFWLTFNSHEIPPWHWKTTFNITCSAQWVQLLSCLFLAQNSRQCEIIFACCVSISVCCFILWLSICPICPPDFLVRWQLLESESENGIFLVGQTERMYLGVQHPCHRKTNSKHHVQTRKTTFGPTFFLQSSNI